MKLNGLNNISLVWFTVLLFRNRPISLKKIHLFLFYYINIIFSIPFHLIKTFLVKKQIERVDLKREPVFILGHFRSGTTYLHKLLLADNNFGYLSNYDFLFPNLSFITGKRTKRFLQIVINKLKIKNYHFNNCIFELDDPNEEDLLIANIPCRFTSCWGFIFPVKWRIWLDPHDKIINDKWFDCYSKVLKEIAFKTDGKRLLLKNPPNTGRIGILVKHFPDAKFIYISRNPYHLYYSLQNLWKNIICKHYALQSLDDKSIDDIIFEHFIAVKERYDNDKELIPKGNLIEITFEDLEAFPYEVIKRVYKELNIDGFINMEIELKRIINRESKYKKFEHSYSPEKNSIIEKRWGKFIRNGNYAPPELIT